MQKKLTVLFVSIFFLMFVGLSDSYADHRLGHNKPPGGGGGSDDKHSVTVDFDDFGCGEGGDHFCSDGQDGMSPYSDEDDNVTAAAGKWGFSLRTGPGRRLFLDFSDCVDAQCGFVPVLDDGTRSGDLMGLTSGSAGGAESLFSIGNPGFSLLEMGLGPDESRDRLVLLDFNDTKNHVWKLSFNPDTCESSTLVKVTRINNETWRFVSFVPDDEDHTGIACLERARREDKGPMTLQGQYFVPFAFTVELLP